RVDRSDLAGERRHVDARPRATPDGPALEVGEHGGGGVAQRGDRAGPVAQEQTGEEQTRVVAPGHPGAPTATSSADTADAPGGVPTATTVVSSIVRRCPPPGTVSGQRTVRAATVHAGSSAETRSSTGASSTTSTARPAVA